MRRLRLLVAIAVAVASVAVLRPAEPSSAAPRLAVYVIVVDGLHPDQVDVLMPSLQAFRDASTSYEQSRAVMVAETIPNHVAMMTGVYPERNGVAVNDYWSRTGEVEDAKLSDPALVTANTLFTTLARRCRAVRTSAVLSKEYLYSIFTSGGRNVAAGDHWDPRPTMIPEPDAHTIDTLTTDAVIERIPTSDFMFVNLGDVDRAGHIDESGAAGVAGFQTFARMQTDRNVERILQAIRDAGRWEQSVVFVLSDHSMDWSAPQGFIQLAPDLPEGLAAIGKGGAETIYLTNPRARNAGALLKRARDLALATDGVEHAWYVRPNRADRRPGTVVPASLHLASPNAGDLILFAEDGWRFADPTHPENPIPGSHGHFVTRHNTFMVGGGAPFLRAPRSVAPSRPDPGPMATLPEQSENVDVAPTVAWLLGLPTGAYQGRVLREAFTARRSPTACGIAR